ncbi:hypothetical protein IEQ34_021176 [Dendrobium chrysotoxum]|uniref:Uncharacterized protein n=1 Tax=Dendrobium chrysotoxum TaxID=161865 RepID=A0AAV7G4C3_DENCH|nr:hypothetical protein IEQ34_021176 [Dendrobium chrysotoxum]
MNGLHCCVRNAENTKESTPMFDSSDRDQNFGLRARHCALRLAITTFREHKASWEGLMKRGMSRNSTWDNAALKYEQVFEWALMDPPYVK